MNNQNSLYAKVLQDLRDFRLDNKSTRNVKYAEQLMSVHMEFVRRNVRLTSLLENYIEQRKKRVETNNFLKKFIFWFFIGLLGILTLAVAIFMIGNINNDSIPSMVSLISVSVTYLASLIAIFEIMSKYLFPIDEEKDTINMIQTVISNDVQVEGLLSKTLCENNNNEIFEELKKLKQLHDDKILSDKEFYDIKEVLLRRIKEK